MSAQRFGARLPLQPAVPDAVARKTALSDVVRVFFNGSAAGAASALLGMSDRLDNDELDELEAMIAQARAGQGRHDDGMDAATGAEVAARRRAGAAAAEG